MLSGNTLCVIVIICLFTISVYSFPMRRLQSHSDINNNGVKTLQDVIKFNCAGKTQPCSNVYKNLGGSVCFIRIITIREHATGETDVSREYDIILGNIESFPIDINNNNPSNILTEYAMVDEKTNQTEVLNFTKIAETNQTKTLQNKLVSCGSGSNLTEVQANKDNLSVKFCENDQRVDTNTYDDLDLSNPLEVTTISEFSTDDNTEIPMEFKNFGEDIMATTKESLNSDRTTDQDFILQRTPKTINSSKIQKLSIMGDIFLIKQDLDSKEELRFRQSNL